MQVSPGSKRSGSGALRDGPVVANNRVLQLALGNGRLLTRDF